MPRFPQILLNVQVPDRVDVDESPAIQAAVRDAEQQLADGGRILVRASGTEPVLRVMVEGEDEDQVSALAEDLAKAIGSAASG